MSPLFYKLLGGNMQLGPKITPLVSVGITYNIKFYSFNQHTQHFLLEIIAHGLDESDSGM
jgi:hypothetical protein